MPVDIQANIDTSSGRGASTNADVWNSIQTGIVMGFQIDNRRLGMIAEQVLFNDNVIDSKSAFNSPNPPGIAPVPGAPAKAAS